MGDVRSIPGVGRLLSVVRLLLAALLALAGARVARAQFSPGPLSRAHQDLEGAANCGACHGVAAGAKHFRCLSCHTDIRERLAERRGLHAVLMPAAAGQEQCARCHSEHNGEDYAQIRWETPVERFDHLKTGYPLEGSHKPLECAKCHNPNHIRQAARTKITMKDLRRTYLGLGRECLSCHADEHRGQLAADCQRCHNLVKWKPAAGFDHARSKFQLVAAHKTVACEKCHPKSDDAAKPFAKYTGLAFTACTPCHNDVHKGAFVERCEACHTEQAWKPARLTLSKFDHSKTDYPLVGKHATVACAKCHRTSNFKQAIAFKFCVDCHKRDPHSGQFQARADRGECGACHKVEGWKPSTFVLARHKESRYPLDGKHAAVECAKCHIPAAEKTIYQVKFARCTDCHRDIHNAQFAGPPRRNRCEDCHTVRGFQPSTFALAKHADTEFPLAGAHLAVPCGDCHASPAGVKAPRPGRFRIADRSCQGCHQDPHKGQFRERMVAARAGGASLGCEACHTVRSWRDMSRFDHSTTSFALIGAHRSTNCGQCHKPAVPTAAVRVIDYHAAPQQCVGCHEDVHAGQFTVRAGTDCARCHSVLEWKRTLFDHDRDSEFALIGAHRDVKCALCHKSRVINGKLVLLYKKTPRECSSCHGSAIVD